MSIFKSKLITSYFDNKNLNYLNIHSYNFFVRECLLLTENYTFYQIHNNKAYEIAIRIYSEKFRLRFTLSREHLQPRFKVKNNQISSGLIDTKQKCKKLTVRF